MRPKLLGQKLLLHERTPRCIELVQVALVVVATVVFAFFERRDRGLLTEQLGAAFDELREGAPRPRPFGGYAAAPADLLPKQLHALLMRLHALLQDARVPARTRRSFSVNLH